MMTFTPEEEKTEAGSFLEVRAIRESTDAELNLQPGAAMLTPPSESGRAGH